MLVLQRLRNLYHSLYVCLHLLFFICTAFILSFLTIVPFLPQRPFQRPPGPAHLEICADTQLARSTTRRQRAPPSCGLLELSGPGSQFHGQRGDGSQWKFLLWPPLPSHPTRTPKEQKVLLTDKQKHFNIRQKNHKYCSTCVKAFKSMRSKLNTLPPWSLPAV